VFDWQSPNRTWGAYDLAYFISGTLEPAQRRASSATRSGVTTSTRGRGVRGYPFDRLVVDYRRSLMVYLGIFAVNGATLEQSNERAVRLFEVIFDASTTPSSSTTPWRRCPAPERAPETLSGSGGRLSPSNPP